MTQQGFPWGRLFAQDAASLTPAEQAKRLGIPIADPNRFKDLAFLYAELATSDPVRRLMLRSGPIDGEIVASRSSRDERDHAAADRPDRDREVASRRRLSSRGALERARQLRRSSSSARTAFPPADRVVVQTAPPGRRRRRSSKPRPKTIPIVVFLVVMLATIGLAFLLENMRPSGPARGGE